VEWLVRLAERALFGELVANGLAAMRAETKRLKRETAKNMRLMREMLDGRP
jgi:hypothetical protein